MCLALKMMKSPQRANPSIQTSLESQVENFDQVRLKRHQEGEISKLKLHSMSTIYRHLEFKATLIHKQGGNYPKQHGKIDYLLRSISGCHKKCIA